MGTGNAGQQNKNGWDRDLDVVLPCNNYYDHSRSWRNEKPYPSGNGYSGYDDYEESREQNCYAGQSLPYESVQYRSHRQSEKNDPLRDRNGKFEKSRKSRKSTKSGKKIKTKRARTASSVIAFTATFLLVVALGILGLCTYGLIRSADRRAAGEDTAQAVLEEVIPVVAPNTESAQQIEEILLGKSEAQTQDATAQTEQGEATASDNITKLSDGSYRVIPASQDTVTFAFAGDILFDLDYATGASALQRGGITGSFDQSVLDLMRSEDVFMVNNEFPYSDRGTPLADKKFTFRATPSTASWLTQMGVDIVSLANNHCYDYGEEAFLDTLSTLENLRMPYVGAGRNLNEAAAPAYFHVQDMTVAIVNSTQIERLDNPDTKGATQDTAGVFRCFDQTKLLEVLKSAKQNADYVILYIHWGTENETQPDWLQTDRIADLSAAGADLIVGDHPHCLQPFTHTGSTMVAYSLGNFLFTSYTVDTGILEASFSTADKALTSLRFVPMLQQDSAVKMADETEKTRILQKLRDISPDVNIDDDGFITMR